jgi:hypothetical protein
METIIVNGVEVKRLGTGTIIFTDSKGVELRANSNIALNALFDRLKAGA